MDRSATSIVGISLVLICGTSVAQQTSAARAKPAECYIGALKHLANGEHKEAYADILQANKLRPGFKPYEQLLA